MIEPVGGEPRPPAGMWELLEEPSWCKVPIIQPCKSCGRATSAFMEKPTIRGQKIVVSVTPMCKECWEAQR